PWYCQAADSASRRVSSPWASPARPPRGPIPTPPGHQPRRRLSSPRGTLVSSCWPPLHGLASKGARTAPRQGRLSAGAERQGQDRGGAPGLTLFEARHVQHQGEGGPRIVVALVEVVPVIQVMDGDRGVGRPLPAPERVDLEQAAEHAVVVEDRPIHVER